MGRWNRRYLPRNKFRKYDYDDPPLSPPPYKHPYSSGGSDNKVPWEIDYCNSAGVPWKKVVASKKYIYSYPSVLNWDASSGEEALQNAKQRFWAMINDLPCEIPLPDPDLYIDEIDWNPYIDPELMENLDVLAFNADGTQTVEKLETINEGVENPWERSNTQGAGSLKDTNDNPWERNNTQGAGSLKDTSDNPWEINYTQAAGGLKDLQVWGKWEDTVNLKNDNPWEQSCSQPVDSLKDSAWKSGNGSWGRSQGIDKCRSSTSVDYRYDNSWSSNQQTMAVRQGQGQGRGRGWGQGQRENNTWGWSPGNINAEKPNNLVSCGYSFQNNYSSGSKERGWRNESWSGRSAKYQAYEPKSWDSQTNRLGGRSFHGGCRKRESSIQYTSRYKSSKYHSDTYGDSHQLFLLIFFGQYYGNTVCFLLANRSFEVFWGRRISYTTCMRLELLLRVQVSCR